MHSNLVVTAAHCFDDPKKKYYVKVGDFDLSRNGRHQQTIEVKQVVLLSVYFLARN